MVRTKQLLQADMTGERAATHRVRVWDAPVRVFHWLMVLCFAGAYLTAEIDSWRLVHVTLGYTMAGLVAFRLVWGLAGTRYARFSAFVRGPRSVLAYMRALVGGHPEHHTGHNPAGALGILALLLMTVLVAATGWAIDAAAGGEAFEEAHEVLANLMLALVGLHVAAVLASSWLHRENLVAAMISGRKAGEPRDAIRSTRRGVAVVLLACVLGFWYYQWQGVTSADASADRPAPAAHGGGRGDDD